MRIIEAGFEFMEEVDGEQIIRKIERAGRVCYKSESRISDDSAERFIRNIIKRGHESVLEHGSISVKIICDRGVTHEIVRHRVASYSQESTRYCNYSSEKFGNEITVIKPCFWEETDEAYAIWKESMEMIEKNYIQMLALGAKPEEARSILPNSLKTEIVVTMNIREWRHFFKLRTDVKAHSQMREIAGKMLEEFKKRIPVLFEDIGA
jgi:thymidylate synthase (FAD)